MSKIDETVKKKIDERREAFKKALIAGGSEEGSAKLALALASFETGIDAGWDGCMILHNIHGVYL